MKLKKKRKVYEIIRRKNPGVNHLLKVKWEIAVVPVHQLKWVPSESSHLDEMAQKENKKTNSVAFPEKLAHLKELVVQSRIRGVSQKDLWVWHNKMQLNKMSINVFERVVLPNVLVGLTKRDCDYLRLLPSINRKQPEKAAQPQGGGSGIFFPLQNLIYRSKEDQGK